MFFYYYLNGKAGNKLFFFSLTIVFLFYLFACYCVTEQPANPQSACQTACYSAHTKTGLHTKTIPAGLYFSLGDYNWIDAHVF